MNKIFLIGRLGDKVHSRSTTSGKQAYTARLATNDGFGEHRKANWHNLTIWGKTGEYLYNTASKGDMLAVTGTVNYKEWQDKQGNTRHSTEVTVDAAELISKSKPKNDTSPEVTEAWNSDFKAPKINPTLDEIPF